MKAAWLFTILFLACGTVHSQSLRVFPVQVAGGQGFPAAIQFYCTEKYSRKDCQNDIFTLRETLVRYSLDRLGSWSFVLASADEWDNAAARLHLPPLSPVFSTLGANMTVISQTIFSGPVDRRAELLRTYKVPLSRLLDVAIAHELGHAFCHEFDEGKATVYGEQMQSGQFPACGSGPRHNANLKIAVSAAFFSANPFRKMLTERTANVPAIHRSSNAALETH